MSNNHSPLSLYCLKYAQSVLPENMAFINGSKEKTIPISFAVYLIKTKDKNILVDAGCETMPGFVMENFKSSVEVLNTLGISAEDITDVIITHSHHDHIEIVNRFCHATVHISEEAYAFGKKYIDDKQRVNVFKEDFYIDDNIKVIKWCGHFMGSAIVEISYDKAVHILAGDECYTNGNIRRKVCTGSYISKEKAEEFVEKYSDKRYTVHTCHDITLKTERII